jgi:hypothetical protein
MLSTRKPSTRSPSPFPTVQALQARIGIEQGVLNAHGLRGIAGGKVSHLHDKR